VRELGRRYEVWLRRGAVVAVLLISWWVLPAVQREVVGLHEFALKKVRNWEVVSQGVAAPLAGEQFALSGRTRALLLLLRTHQPESYRCSQAILASDYDFQRIVESAWPIRYDEAALVELSLLSETTNCEVLGEQRMRNQKTGEEHGVRIALCP
jgi:hypothetical protein